MLETHGRESDLASSLAPRVASCTGAPCTATELHVPCTLYLQCMCNVHPVYCASHPEWLLALEQQNLPSCRQLQMVRSDTETLPLLIFPLIFPFHISYLIFPHIFSRSTTETLSLLVVPPSGLPGLDFCGSSILSSGIFLSWLHILPLQMVCHLF